MAINGYLNIPGIEGESLDDSHAEQIEVYSVGWGIAQPDAGPGSIRQRGMAQFSTFDFAKGYSRSSPYLAEAVANGKVFDEIVFAASRPEPAGGGFFDYLTITLSEVAIVNYQLGTDVDRLVEVVSLRAQKIHIDYQEVGADGQPGGHNEVDISAGAR